MSLAGDYTMAWGNTIKRIDPEDQRSTSVKSHRCIHTPEGQMLMVMSSQPATADISSECIWKIPVLEYPRKKYSDNFFKVFLVRYDS